MLRETLGREHARHLRFVDPALVHLTLRFLGETSAETEARLVPLLDDAVRPLAPFDLVLARPGTFGASTRPSVVWLGVDGAVAGDMDVLRLTATAVDRATREAGVDSTGGRFSPHLTIARLRRDASAEASRAVVDAVRALPSPPVAAHHVGAVVVVQSILGGAQPEYRVRSRYPLRGGSTRRTG